jgi:hypothetical protein
MYIRQSDEKTWPTARAIPSHTADSITEFGCKDSNDWSVPGTALSGRALTLAKPSL